MRQIGSLVSWRLGFTGSLIQFTHMLSECLIIIHLLVANDAEEVPQTAMHFSHVAGVYRVAIETHITRSALPDAGVVVKSLNVRLEVFLVPIWSGAMTADPATVLVSTVQVVC